MANSPSRSVGVKLLVRAAWLSLLAPVGAYIWYYVVRVDDYFPGRYEDAFSGMAISLAVAAPGLLVLLGLSVRRLFRIE